MFSKKGLLFFTALALLVFVEQASAGPNANAVLSVDIDASDNKMNDGNTSGTAVTGTDIVVEVFISGLAGPIVGGEITFDTDKLTVKSATPPTGFFVLGTTDNSASFGAVPSGTLTNDYFATVTLTPIAGVTASTEFTVGVSVKHLAPSSNPTNTDDITAVMPLSFNEPASGEFDGLKLYLDTQIETPATYNNMLTIPEKKTGDTIQLQLFVPMAAGKQTYGYEIQLDLPSKTFSNYIGSISGTDFTGASLFPTPGRPILSALLLSTPAVPANGYLGQIDLQVTNTLEAETTLIVKTASMAGLNRHQDPLNVSDAAISIRISYPGDFDGDLDVDFADYLAFINVFGLSSSDANYDTRMDMNDDGIINFADFLIFAGVFGTTHS